MTMLSVNDLADVRATQADAMPDTCTISRRSLTYAGPVGSSKAWSNLATGVAIRISRGRGSPSEEEIANLIQGKVWWIGSLLYNQDITRKDRVVIGSTTYEVVGVMSVGSWMTDKLVALLEIN